jgi:N-dimethylarginine dimethylaminohydrolase
LDMELIEQTSKNIDKSLPAVPIDLNYNDELRPIWGKEWGAQSEIGRLRKVLVKRPGPEIVHPLKDLKWYGMKDVVDLEKARAQHDNLVQILKGEKIDVEYMEAPEMAKGPYDVLRGLWGTRDFGFVVNGGAIVHRMSLPWDRGGEVFWAKKIMELGCPILSTVRGFGLFEGGNVVWLDPTRVCIGNSIRTNQEGIDQVSEVLKSVGVEEVKIVPLPGWLDNTDWPAGGFAHLDCVFGYADSGLAVIYPPAVPYDFLEYLRRNGVRMIEVPPDEARDYACNIFALEPGKVLMLDGFEFTKTKLEKEGVDVITVGMSEFIKIGGGPHCATSPLIRDSGPKLSERK